MCSHWKLRLEDVGRNRGDTGWYLYWFFCYPVPGLEKPTISPKIRFNKADILDIIDWRGMPENEMHSMCSLKLKPWDGIKRKVCWFVRWLDHIASLYSSAESENSWLEDQSMGFHGYPWLPRFALKRNSKLTFDVLIHKAGWKPRHLRLTQNPRNAKILKVHMHHDTPLQYTAIHYAPCLPLASQKVTQSVTLKMSKRSTTEDDLQLVGQVYNVFVAFDWRLLWLVSGGWRQVLLWRPQPGLHWCTDLAHHFLCWPHYPNSRRFRVSRCLKSVEILLFK